jgi:predicted RNA-binding protein associated with RNAse of E/G family
MAAITFDTLKFVEKLESAGVNREQAKAEAEALVTALSEAMDSQLATKSDINRLIVPTNQCRWVNFTQKRQFRILKNLDF